MTIINWLTSLVVMQLLAQVEQDGGAAEQGQEVAKQAAPGGAGTGDLYEEISRLLGMFQAMLREQLGPRLKTLQEPVDQWLGTLPMSVAMACAIGLYLLAAAWVWTLRRDFVYRGAPDSSPWRDLRIWGTLLLVPYVALYWLLGR